MKEYINQIYTEGLATTFYLKPIKFLKKKIKNKKVRKIFVFLFTFLYTYLLLLLVCFALYKGFNLK